MWTAFAIIVSLAALVAAGFSYARWVEHWAEKREQRRAALQAERIERRHFRFVGRLRKTKQIGETLKFKLARLSEIRTELTQRLGDRVKRGRR